MNIFTHFFKKTFAIFNTFSVITSQALFANQIIIDTTQTPTNPHLTHSQNNIDIVNIAKPNQAGISNNFYHEFNVAKEGLILNNILSQNVLAKTELAGFIYSNPNLDAATAKLILNQVTGENISQLLGYLEIAGNKADMLLANPNGITCQGCGFINAGNVSLATGILSKEELERLNNLKEYNALTPLALSIKRGEILVEALDAKNVASLTLLARSMNVTDSLQAQNLRILLGSNQVTFSPLTLLYKPITLNGEKQEGALALDVAYLGSILSNKIFIVATDKGVGIKNAGIIASTTSQNNGDNGFVLRADGKIEIARPLEITAKTDILTAQAPETTNANPDVHAPTIRITPLFYSESNMDIQADSIENHAIIHAQNNIYLKADSILNKGFADIEKKVISTEKFNSWHPTINGTFGSHGGSNTKHTIYTYDIVTSHEYINEETYSPSMILGRNITAEASDFTNDTGIIYAADSFNNYAKHFTNISPELRQIISYENGQQVAYDRYGKCSWWSWISKKLFCNSAYTTSSFTRASEYSLLDFVAPDINLQTIQDVSKNTIITAIHSKAIQPNTYQNDYQTFISSNEFHNHLTGATLQFVSNSKDNTFYAMPANSLTESSDKSWFALTNYTQKLRNLSADNSLLLQTGIWADTINIDSANILNSSTIHSHRDMMIAAEFMINENGQIASKEGLNLKAHSFQQNGGKLRGETVNIQAKDINITSSTFSNKEKNAYKQQFSNVQNIHKKQRILYPKNLKEFVESFDNPQYHIDYTESSGSNTTLASKASIEGDNINIFAQNTYIAGADILAKDNVFLQSDSIKIDTIATHSNYANAISENKKTRHIGSSIHGNNVLLQAQDDMSLVSANLEAKDNIALNTNGSITINTAKDTDFSKTHETSKEYGFTYSQTTKTTTQDYQAINLASNFSANNITMNAGKNINAYNLNATGDSVSLNAKDNLTLSNHADSHTTSTEIKKEKSGLNLKLNRKEFDFSVGKDKVDINAVEMLSTHNNAAINAQNIALHANNFLSVESSDINGLGNNSSVLLTGQDISVKALDNEYKNDVTTHSTSNRFGVGISFDSGLRANLGFTHKNEKIANNTFDTQAASSNIAQDTINIHSQNETNIIGSNLAGKEIALSGNDVNIVAKQQNNQTSTKTTSHEATLSVGISIGKDTNVNLSAKYAYENTNENTQSITHRDSTLQAQNLKIHTNDSTNIIGSRIDTQNATIQTASFNLSNATDRQIHNKDSKGLDVQAGLTYNGLFGFSGSADYKQSKESSSSASAHVANFNANNLMLTSTDNTNIIGSNLDVSNVADIQTNDFNVLAAKHTSTNNKSGFDAQGSFTIGISPSFSLGGNYNTSHSSINTHTASKLNLGTLALSANGDTNIIGSSVNAETAAISTNTLNLVASQDTQTHRALNLSGEIGTKRNQFQGTFDRTQDSNNNNASITTQNLNLTTKNDSNLIGATIESKNINANISGNLNIMSLQDSKQAMNLSASFGTSNDFNTSLNHYINTDNQSGITADSINIQVEKDTRLQGAYIEGNKGVFNTDSLTSNNLTNTAVYTQNTYGKIPKFGADRGITHSSISEGISLQSNSDNPILRSEKTNHQVINQSQVVPKRNMLLNEGYKSITQSINNPTSYFANHVGKKAGDVVGTHLTPVTNEIQAKYNATSLGKGLLSFSNSYKERFINQSKGYVSDYITRGIENALTPRDKE